MLTAAAMIGAIGGVLLWLIVAHRESAVAEGGHPPAGTGSQADAGEAGSTESFIRTTRESGGPSLPTPSADEALIRRAPMRTFPTSLRSDATLFRRASPGGPVGTTTLVHPGAALGSASARSAAGKAARPVAAGRIDGALTFALEAAHPYEKEGFAVREDYWGGDLRVRQPKAIVHQLYKGNAYWFWVGADGEGAKITVHIYDSHGRLMEAESWQKPSKAAAMVVPKETGTYYLILELEKSPQEWSAWALAYGFR